MDLRNAVCEIVIQCHFRKIWYSKKKKPKYRKRKIRVIIMVIQ